MYDPITVFLIVCGLFSVGLFLLMCFLPRKVPLAICCTVGLVVLNSLTFCFSGELLTSPSNWKESCVLGFRFFPFITFDYYGLVCSSLGLSCLGLSASWTRLFPFPCLGSFQQLSLQVISQDLFLLLLGPLWCECWCVQCCLRGLSGCLHFLFILFSIFCSMAVISTILSSGSFISSSASVIQLIPPTVLFICGWLSLSSSRSLVNISCIFSTVFPRSWIIFTIIILNSFSGTLPVSTSFSCFPGILSCAFIWDITTSSCSVIRFLF